MTRTSQAQTRLLVIGYGNTLRGDDGVGPKLAEAVEALSMPGVTTLICDLLTPELADTISKAGTVVFVDATIARGAEAQLHELLPANSSQLLAHAADPKILLALARDVFGHAPKAWWLTIPIESTAFTDSLSETATQSLRSALLLLQPLLTGSPDQSD
jgi:hydrogenase maturation protease